MNTPSTDPVIERYLDRVRGSLRGMPGSEVEEILRELRGHIVERAEAEGPEAALRSLGDPVDLARQYRADSVTARAECSRSPIVILYSLLLVPRGRFAKSAVLTLTALGFAWAFAMGGAAIEKILAPGDVGLWYRPGVVSLPRITVDGPGPPGTHELLGWWFVPVGAAACAVLFLLTRQFALWWIRRSRGGRSALST